MNEWRKRLQVLTEMARKGGSRLARRAGGKWIPSAMRGLASGLSGASKLLNSGAKKLRKNVKTFSGLLSPAPAPVPVHVRHRTPGIPR